uniref:CX domain-containing protein n=1 Tax=Plectus sambesii TaxID=2011161 RepID=A0A914XQU3_9BILA
MANLFAIGVASTRSVNSISCSNRLPFSSDSVRQRLLRRYGRAEILISMKDKSRRQMTVLRESTFADYYLTYYIDPPFVPLAHVHTCRSPVKNMSAVFLALTAVGGQAVALLKNQSARLDFSMRTAADKVSFYRHARWFYFSCPANSGCCGMHCCTKETEKVQLQFEDYAASLKRDFPYLTSDTVVQFRNKNYSLTEPINTLPDLQKQCEYTLQPEDRIFSLLNYRKQKSVSWWVHSLLTRRREADVPTFDRTPSWRGRPAGVICLNIALLPSVAANIPTKFLVSLLAWNAIQR